MEARLIVVRCQLWPNLIQDLIELIITYVSESCLYCSGRFTHKTLQYSDMKFCWMCKEYIHNDCYVKHRYIWDMICEQQCVTCGLVKKIIWCNYGPNHCYECETELPRSLTWY